MGCGFVVAGISSGSGKTTVTNGLIRALCRKGWKVSPFKTGPDYIDTQYHRVAAGRDSINLDLFMSDEGHVLDLFNRYSADSDISIVEGVMGLFDGYDGRARSAADISLITGLPVVLVVDAKSSAYSLGAVLYGFRTFDPNVNIAGVIFNNVSSHNHLRLLKMAAKDAGLCMLGYMPRNAALSVPSRHLGLRLDNDDAIRKFVEHAADMAERYIDLETLLATIDANKNNKAECSGREGMLSSNEVDSGKRIAVAYDEAFNFIYPENLRVLQTNSEFGGDIVRFSPIHDSCMPDADFLYLPGGYPELYKEVLGVNSSMRESIRYYIENGGYALAECGGMLYLGEEIDGSPMCGVFPLRGTMEGARLHLGYREVRTDDFSIRGHEFHYSSVIEDKERIGHFIYPACQYDVRGNLVSTPIYRHINAIAGYTHLYWADTDISRLYKI